MTYDPVNHPKHYVEQSATIEPIDVLRFAPFDLGNALKYLIRAGHKDDKLQDLRKAEWYLKCALKTEELNCEFYDAFLSRYYLILKKFGLCTTSEAWFTAESIMVELLKETQTRIKHEVQA